MILDISAIIYAIQRHVPTNPHNFRLNSYSQTVGEFSFARYRVLFDRHLLSNTAECNKERYNIKVRHAISMKFHYVGIHSKVVVDPPTMRKTIGDSNITKTKMRTLLHILKAISGISY